MPCVSIVIPTYNCARYILAAIQSVFTQTFDDYEIIVVDDGSTDDTREVLQAWSSRLRYIYQQNRGQAAARNAGIRASSGQYLVFLDADDLILPRKLEVQASVLDAVPQIGVVYSDFYFWLDNSSKQIWQLRSTVPGWRSLSGNVLDEIMQGNWLATNCAMLRRQCFDEVGFFDETLSPVEDWDLWVRLAGRFKFQYHDYPSSVYRVHGANISLDYAGTAPAQIRLLEKIIASPSFQRVSRQTKRDCYYRHAFCHLCLDNSNLARQSLRKALTADLLYLKAAMLFMLSPLGSLGLKGLLAALRQVRRFLRLPVNPFTGL